MTELVFGFDFWQPVSWLIMCPQQFLASCVDVFFLGWPGIIEYYLGAQLGVSHHDRVELTYFILLLTGTFYLALLILIVQIEGT